MKDVLLCNYIEKLRYARKITQEELVFNVCDIRQYKRYRRGENKLPLQVLIGFTKKLGVNLINLLVDFESEKRNEVYLLNSFYNAIVSHDLNEAKKVFELIDGNHIIDLENKMYYIHSLHLFELYKGTIGSYIYIKKTVELIDYPKILYKDVLTDIEFLVLSSLLDFRKQMDVGNVVMKLEEFLKFHNGDFLKKKNDYLIPLVLVSLSKYYGEVCEYDMVEKYCIQGIAISKEIKSSYLLEYYYYYLSLIYFERNEEVMYAYNLFQCFNSLNLHCDKKAKDKFEGYILKDFRITYEDFISEYVKKPKK